MRDRVAGSCPHQRVPRCTTTPMPERDFNFLTPFLMVFKKQWWYFLFPGRMRYWFHLSSNAISHQPSAARISKPLVEMSVICSEEGPPSNLRHRQTSGSHERSYIPKSLSEGLGAVEKGVCLQQAGSGCLCPHKSSAALLDSCNAAFEASITHNAVLR